MRKENNSEFCAAALRLQQAQDAYRECNVPLAEASLMAVLSDRPDDVDALNLLGLVMIRKQAHREAARTLQRAAQIDRQPHILANLANAYVYAGDHATAETVCRQALAMDELPEVYNTLGSLLAMRKAYGDAIDSFARALALRPDYTQARCNLANARFLAGDIERAFEDCLTLVGYQQGTMEPFEDALKAAWQNFAKRLAISAEVANTFKELTYLVLPAHQWSSGSSELTEAPIGAALHYEANIRSAIGHWLTAEYPHFDHALKRAAQLREKGIRSSKTLKNVAAYERYLLALRQTPRASHLAMAKPTAVLGDSHVLAWHGQAVSWGNDCWRLEAELIMGAKAYHIAAASPNRFQWRLKQMLQRIPAGAPVIFSFGEIDCRLDEGLLPFIRKTGASLAETVQEQARAYANAVRRLVPPASPIVWVIGVPAPNITSLRTSFPEADSATFALLKEIIRLWNVTLQEACQQLALGFVDLYGLTAGSDGASNLQWHCDGVHLQPAALKEARWTVP